MNFLERWFDIFDFSDRDRPHLQVHIDPTKHKMLAFDIRGQWRQEELEAGLSQFLVNFTHLCRDIRHDYLQKAIEEAKREAGLLDKVLSRPKRWVEQAELHVPQERFIGEAANGAIRIEIDGRMAFHRVEVGDLDSEAILPLARQALKNADRLCFERWRACLLGALDSQALLQSASEEIVDVTAEVTE